MPNDTGSHPIYYHKLVRDKIPSIIRDNDHQPTGSNLSGQDLTQAANQKLLEAVYELFTEVQIGEESSVLKESADVLEVVLTILKQLGYSFDDLISEMERRREQKGGFEQGLFLESVDGQCLGARLEQSPGFVCTHLESDSLLELFRGEMERSDKARIASAFYSPAITDILTSEFEALWANECVHVTDDFLAGYRERHRDVFQEREKPFDTYGTEGQSSNQPGIGADSSAAYGKRKQFKRESVSPNIAQGEALEGLLKLRKRKARSGAVIAATGVGKTYLAAFDFIQSGKDKCLFIAHREDILRKAKQSFSHVLGPEGLGIFSGRSKEISHGSRAVFAMIQTLGRQGNMERFHPREFDYIVMDEFHHAMAATYRRVLDYFQPDFLLGLTATPERMDGRDVLWLCD
ncbi:MAG: DEAD/DEAH box helicase family protein [Desulfovermiculus sp.]|nr:DEAD/DEAH box helicase family protein [Desulfovermiculus sp.]